MLVLLLAAVPMALIMLQPDLGTTLVRGFVVLGVLAVAGAPVRWIVGLLLAGAAVVVLAVHLGVLSDYQVARFAAFADPALDPRGVGYDTSQARIAIGSGGLFGKGLFHGRADRPAPSSPSSRPTSCSPSRARSWLLVGGGCDRPAARDRAVARLPHRRSAPATPSAG